MKIIGFIGKRMKWVPDPPQGSRVFDMGAEEKPIWFNASFLYSPLILYID